MIDTVIFDLDGTLLDTLEDLADSVNYALAVVKLPKRTLEEIRTFVGNGVEILIKRAVNGALDEEEEKECLAIFKEHYRKNMNNKTKPYAGVLALIRCLKKDYHIAIVSNKFDHAVKELNTIYFEGMFSVAIGAAAGIEKKPAPDAVYEALRQLKVSKERAIYVGDSDVDLHTAENAGLPFVGVTWGFRDEQLLRELGADDIIHQPEQLLDILARRNNY